MNDKKLKEITLTLFFTGGVGLKTWAQVGNLDRELEIYKKLSRRLKKVNFVTYGGKEDNKYLASLGKINLLPINWHLNHKLTLLHLLFKYGAEIRKTDILKTNQIPGSEIPIWLKKHFGKKLIVRCGYLHSRNTAKETKDKKFVRNALLLEKNAFNAADLGIVTSKWQRYIVISKYKIDPGKIKVVPNYVLTNIFQPYPKIKKSFDLVFVGRNGKEKNITNLLRAIYFLKTKKINISLLMIGSCCKNKELINYYNLDITFMGNVSNFDLPRILNQAKIFILPSFYEGHPKALLEAMSCGLPCIGTDVTGIKEDIKHQVTGYLCKTNYQSIAYAIEDLLKNQSLQKKLGKNARSYIKKNYSFDRILKMEIKTIQNLI